MTKWSPQRFRYVANSKRADPTVIAGGCQTGEQILRVDGRLPVILTLKHLCLRAQVPYGIVRNIVSRRLVDPYRSFYIKKRAKNSARKPPQQRLGPDKGTSHARKAYRRICVPSPVLMRLQRWIDKRILSIATPHCASVAYTSGAKLIEAARPHCGARWLIKLDITNFFETISEIDVYRVFNGLGYQPLMAFELARICTRLGSDTKFSQQSRFRVRWSKRREGCIKAYISGRMGRLAQGAPTSPRLSNLVMRLFDAEVSRLAAEYDMRYTRYADDLCLSTTRRDFDRDTAKDVISRVYRVMLKAGLQPNITKAAIIPPGARKIVLGLTVNDVAPRLPHELKHHMRMHLHYLLRVGPVEHARARKFSSLLGMYRHLFGIAAFASQIEPELGQAWRDQLNSVDWP